MYRKHLINRYIYTKYIGKDKQQVIIGRQLHPKIWCKSNTSFAYYYTLRCLSSKKKKKKKGLRRSIIERILVHQR